MGLMTSCNNNFNNTQNKLNSIKTGESKSSVKVKISFSDTNSFSTKANRNGTNYSAYNHVKLVLSTNSGDPYNNPAFIFTPVSPAVIGAGGSLSITGLVPNTTYYLAAKAFSDAGGTINVTEGIVANATESLTINQDGSSFTLNNDVFDVGNWNISLSTKASDGAAVDTNLSLIDGVDNFGIKEQLIPTISSGNQLTPDISINELGKGGVVWRETSSPNEIHFSAINDYSPSGIEQRVEANAASTLLSPTIGLNDFGNGGVFWNVSASNPSIKYTHIQNYEINPLFKDLATPGTPITTLEKQRVKFQKTGNIGLLAFQNSPSTSISGVVLDGGVDNFKTNIGMISSNIIVNTSPDTPTNVDLSTPIAGSPSKTFVVWENKNGVSNNSIKGRGLTNLVGSSFTQGSTVKISQSIVSGSIENNYNPRVSLNSLGNGLVVWEHSDSLNPNTHTNEKIFARKIENYKAVGIEFQVDKLAPTVKKQLNPSVYVDDNGNGVIVWDDDRNGALFKYLFGIKLSNYYPIGESAVQFTVNSSIKNSSNASPRMSINSLGRGMIVSDSETSTGAPDIYGTRLRDFYSQ